MDTLPDLALLRVLQFLTFDDLIKTTKLCWRMRILGNSESLWKSQCKFYWLLDNLPKDCDKWKDAFILHYEKYKNVMGSYRKVKLIWNDLELWLMKNCATIYESLNKGIAEEKLRQFEEEKGIILPEDFKASYMIHNGQGHPTEPGLLGSYFLPFYGANTITLLDFDTASEHYDEIFACTVPIATVKPKLFAIGQVFMSENLSEKEKPYQCKIVKKCYQEGTETVVVANSFSDWLSEYTDLLTSCSYLINENRILLYHKATESKCTTGYITVKVRWRFLPYADIFYVTSNETRMFSYYITMAMSADAPAAESCQLVSRHWDIVDGDGKKDTVEGDGVVGEYPVMTPGALYSWNSFTSFTTECGSMKGYFVMKKLSKLDSFVQIVCPEFKMTPVLSHRFV